MNPITSEYSLSWGGHMQHVKKAFNKLLQSNELCDVTLYVEGRKIRAHKILLSACSEYFDQLFKDLKDERPIVVLKGMQYNILEHILNFIYNGETNVEMDQLNQFLESAAFLKIKGLTENQLKRKRRHSIPSESDNGSIEYEKNQTSNMEIENVEKGQSKKAFGSLKLSDMFSKQQKVYKTSSPDKALIESLNVPDLTIAPKMGKYSIDSPKRVGDWLSDYEFNSQSSIVESHEHTDNPLGETADGTAVDELIAEPDDYETYIKSEISNEAMGGVVEEVSSFDQNDFANSLDVEIEISEDADNDTLEKQLLESSLASIDEEGLHHCKICGKSYIKKDSLKKHFAVHVHNTSCMICGKVLSRKSHLRRHLKMHGVSAN